MKACEIVDAIKRKHVGAAMLTEVVIDTPNEVGVAQAYTRRIDLLIWRSLQRTAVEVKVSRGDYLRETAEKRDAWRNHTHRFVYATPSGLLHPEEIPIGCGLWEVDECGKVRVIVRARVNHAPRPLPEWAVQGLAYRAMRQEFTAAEEGA